MVVPVPVVKGDDQQVLGQGFPGGQKTGQGLEIDHVKVLFHKTHLPVELLGRSGNGPFFKRIILARNRAHPVIGQHIKQVLPKSPGQGDGQPAQPMEEKMGQNLFFSHVVASMLFFHALGRARDCEREQRIKAVENIGPQSILL